MSQISDDRSMTTIAVPDFLTSPPILAARRALANALDVPQTSIMCGAEADQVGPVISFHVQTSWQFAVTATTGSKPTEPTPSNEDGSSTHEQTEN